MLENACMKDEPLPQPLKDRGGVGPASLVSPGGLMGSYPGVINEESAS
jgi:hypothetical protein